MRTWRWAGGRGRVAGAGPAAGLAAADGRPAGGATGGRGARAQPVAGNSE